MARRALICLLVCGAVPAVGWAQDGSESDYLTRVRRLTYEGVRAGEGYYSPDGSKMVLQSERESGNPFYQIYLLDLETGESERVSTGMGKTTCAFIRPGTGEVEYASTHHDPETANLQREELEFRASGQERRYAWDYDPEMEIYVTDPASGETTRLTNARGYDAEGSYSPDGEWIVFASNRNVFARDLTAEETKQLEIDPAYFAEIWIMRADGSDQRQLTDTPGYDGGPFFFPDGSRIIWRRFDESGLTADVWSMKPDGSDQRRLTDFASMSWAPYVHPSHEYVFFASNKLGFANFEVFMVDMAGEKEPVRVTFAEGFDGLPVPSPDGTQLAWTSQRHGEKGAQIFLAQWNHDKAMAALAAAPPRVENSKEQD
jgi:Tol biopolymer transport system component